MAALQARFFGSPEVTLEGGKAADLRSAKARALLAYLTVEAEQAHRREKLVDLLWPEYSESSARANLRRALADLRQAIGDHQAAPPFLHVAWETIQFNTNSAAWVDVVAFKRLLENSNRSGTDLSHVEIDCLEQVVGLYRGPFLEGFSIQDSAAFEGWALLVREKFQREALQSLHRLAEVYIGLGEHERALPYAWRQVEMEPWQEGGHRQVMEVLALTGQRGAALAQYEVCRRVLETELGVTPSSQTRDLYDLIREGEWPPDDLKLPTRVFRPTGACPYRGLAAFREQDASLFFGREPFTARLVAAVCRPENATVLVGPSGSGKSSVVFAGLLPCLRETEGWLITTFRPGGQPFQSLAAALRSLFESSNLETGNLLDAARMAMALQTEDGFFSSLLDAVLQKQSAATRILLVIDQFEELFTLCTNQALRRQFLDVLLAEDPRVKRLIILRADFLGQALSYSALADLLQAGVLLLGPMTRVELQAAIEKPAENQGAAFEPGLVDRILDDVGEEPGSLPLLAFALLLLWEKQDAGWLTHHAYEEIGQVGGALTCYAEQVYDDLEAAARAKMPRFFLQLVRPGDTTGDTRRVATKSEIGETVWPLVQLLADRRLVVTGRALGDGEETAEVAHEALIQKWGRLREWLEADRAFRTWQEDLRAAMRSWLASDKDEGALLRGAPLGVAERWLAERGADLGEIENQYIGSSMQARDKSIADRETHRQREFAAERKARRLYGALTGVLLIAVIIALGLTSLALQQRRQAQEAFSLSMAVNARNALDDRDSSSGLALALAANQIANPPREARRTLLDAAYSSGPRWLSDVRALFPDTQGPVTALAISPDGGKSLSGLGDGTLILWDMTTRAEVLRIPAHSGRVNDVAFSPDGLFGLSGGDDHQVVLSDLSSGEVLRYFSSHSGTVRTVGFSPDGSRILSGGFAGDAMLAPGELILWDIPRAAEIRRFAGHLSGITAARFTPDGRAVLASSGDAAIFSDQLSGEALEPGTAPFDLILWDAATGDPIWRDEGNKDDVFSLAISPDGTRALAGSFYNNHTVLWDLETGQRLLTLEGHAEGVRTAVFSPDGQLAITGSADDSLIIWDLATGQPRVVLKAHAEDVLSLAVSPDGRTALSSARDGGLVLWDLVDAAQVQQLAGHGDMVYDVAFTPDGLRALSASGSSAPSVPVKDASIRLWDLETGAQIKSQEVFANVIFQVAISPDGGTALLATDQPSVIVWDLVAWREIGRLDGHPAAVTAVGFSPNNQQALTLGIEGSLILWDVPHRQAIRQMAVPGEGLWSLAISPDGHTALTDTGVGSMILWDLATGEQLRVFERSDVPAEPGVSGMVFMPDGRQAISCEQDGDIIEWDMETGTEIRRLGMHRSLRTRVVVSLDGSLAFTSGMDGSLMLWDLEMGDLVRETHGHGVIFDLAISPDGLTALFGTSDTRVYQWWVSNPTLSELLAWIKSNRYVRDPMLTK